MVKIDLIGAGGAGLGAESVGGLGFMGVIDKTLKRTARSYTGQEETEGG